MKILLVLDNIIHPTYNGWNGYTDVVIDGLGEILGCTKPTAAMLNTI